MPSISAEDLEALMSIDDRRGHRWDIRVPEGAAYSLAVLLPDGLTPVSVTAEVFLFRGVKVADLGVVPGDGSLTLVLPADALAVSGDRRVWALTVDGVQWLTGDLTVTSAGSWRTGDVAEQVPVIVGGQVQVEVSVVSPTVPADLVPVADVAGWFESTSVEGVLAEIGEFLAHVLTTDDGPEFPGGG